MCGHKERRGSVLTLRVLAFGCLHASIFRNAHVFCVNLDNSHFLNYDTAFLLILCFLATGITQNVKYCLTLLWLWNLKQPVVPTILFLMIRYTRMYFTTMKCFVSSQLYILIAVCTVVCYFSLKSEVSVLLALYFCSIIIQKYNCFLTGFLIVLPQTNFIGWVNVLNIVMFLML